MGKYEPLGAYLREQRTQEVPLSFAQIERITGVKLPPKAQNHRAWWSNNPSNNVMTKVWLEAGFETEQVDIPGRKVVFRRVVPREAIHSDSASPATTASKATTADRGSMIGWMKGTVTIAPGVDLTEPADPEWGKRVWGNET